MYSSWVPFLLNKPDLGCTLLLLLLSATAMAFGEEVARVGVMVRSEARGKGFPRCVVMEGYVSLFWRRILCSTLVLEATAVVDKERWWSREMDIAFRVGAYPRRPSRRSYGTHNGSRLPVSSISPSNLLAEWQPFCLLLPWKPKGRHFTFWLVSMASFSGMCGCGRRSYGSPIVPTGLVPDDSEVATKWKLRTHLRSSFSVWGYSCKFQGPIYNFIFILGPVVNCH